MSVSQWLDGRGLRAVRLVLPALAFLAVAFLCCCAIPLAHAENYEGGLPLSTVKSGVVSGGLYVDASPAVFSYEALAQTKTFTLPAEAVAQPGRIAWARLYVSVYCGHMQNNYVASAAVSLDGNGDGSFETTLDPLLASENAQFVFKTNGGNPPGGQPWMTIDDHTTRVSSDYLMWYDVTGSLTGQNPRVRVNTAGSFDGRVKVITLVVAYDDGDDDQIYYWVNQGHDVDSYYMDYPMYAPLDWNDYIGSTTFSGIPAAIGDARLTVNHMASSDGQYTFGGQDLSRYSSADGNSYVQGAYCGYDVWDVTGLIGGGSATLTYDRSAMTGGTGEFSGQFYKIPLATLAVKKQQTAAPVTDFTANATRGMAPLAVLFTDTSTGSPTAWAWDFDGDGVTDSTEQNPVHVYDALGQYSVSLTASGPRGSYSTIKNNYIAVTLFPCIYFAPGAQETGPGTTKTFDIIVDRLPQGLAGFRLNVILNDSRVANISAVTSPSWAVLGYSSALPAGNLTISGIDLLDMIKAGATNVTLATVAVRGEHAGTAELSVEADRFDADRGYQIDTAVISGLITVMPANGADFTATPLAGMIPLTVQFTDTSAGSPTAWEWDFDNDGTTDGTEQNPAYTYTVPGNYSVKLTVRDQDGSRSCLKGGYVNASAVVPPVANFFANVTAGMPPLTVQFTDTSAGSPTAWEWDFDNDGTADSTAQNPVYTYAVPGNYTVKLTVTGPGGSDVLIKPGYVNASTTPPCDLAFYSLSIMPQVQTVFAREPNNVRLFVVNNGPAGSPPTAVELRSNDGLVVRATVPALASGGQTIVLVADATVRQQAGAGITYTATLDPDGVVYETNETNNVKTGPSWTVAYNGYKGKRYWDGGSDDNTVLTFDLRGGIVHSFGDSIYTSGSFGESGWNTYTVSWTAGNLPIPAGAVVKAARLYAPYTWDNTNVAPDHTHIAFNGQTVPYQHWYHDVSNFGAYADHVYGLLTYDVTSLFRKNAANSAVFTRDGSPNTKISMYGFTLLVVYEDASATRKQIFLNEEFDLLGADPDGYATSPEEATAFYRFSGMTIDRVNVTGARLVTFIPSGAAQTPDAPGEGVLLFNDQVIGNNVWDYGSSYGPQVAVDDRDVKAWLQAGENVAGIRSTTGSTPCLAAAQGFLVVDYGGNGATNSTVPVVGTENGTASPSPSGSPDVGPGTTSGPGSDGHSPGTTVARTSTSLVPWILSVITLLTVASAFAVFFVLNAGSGAVGGGAVVVGRRTLPLKFIVPALLITVVLVAMAGGFVAGQSSSQAGPSSPQPGTTSATGDSPPNATFKAIAVIQDIRDTDVADRTPDYPADFSADNGILFGEESGDLISLDKVRIRLSSGGSEITLGPQDVMPAVNCTSGETDRYYLKTGGSGEVTIGPGDWFMLYADNCFDDSGSAEGGGKALSWAPADSSSPFVTYLGVDCEYRIIDYASGSVIQQGTIRFGP